MNNNVIYGINGPVVTVKNADCFEMMEMVHVGAQNLVGEVIGITDRLTTIQVYEETTGLKPGDPVTGTGAPMNVLLGPGILDNIFDGIERPLKEIEQQAGAFISRGASVSSLDPERLWTVTLKVKPGDRLEGGQIYATLPETPIIEHRVLLHPNLSGVVKEVKPDGEYRLHDDGINYLLVGGEIYYTLAMRPHAGHAAAVHIPKRGTASMGFTLDQAFNTGYAYPAGYFFIQQDIDREYVVSDIDFVRQLMDYAPDEVSALALRLEPGTSVQRVKKSLRAQTSILDAQLTVKDRYDQQPLYFKIFRTERLGIYLILSLIVLISTLSLVASLSLLIINKSRDIFILQSMGMTRQQLRRTFRAEGLLICAVAVVAGLAIGFVVCWLQQQFGIIRMGDGNFVVSTFPVAMRGVDFLATFLLVMAISTASVTLTVHRAKI
jgi:hypothetical protein